MNQRGVHCPSPIEFSVNTRMCDVLQRNSLVAVCRRPQILLVPVLVQSSPPRHTVNVHPNYRTTRVADINHHAGKAVTVHSHCFVNGDLERSLGVAVTKGELNPSQSVRPGRAVETARTRGEITDQ